MFKKKDPYLLHEERYKDVENPFAKNWHRKLEEAKIAII